MKTVAVAIPSRAVMAAVLLMASNGIAAPEVSLEPGATVQFAFPDLPPTLHAQARNEPAPAKLTARLPDNYDPKGKWPLFVFVSGGVGAKGDDASAAREIVGPRDFVAVSMPLFQRTFDPKQMLGGIALTIDDFETLRAAYRTMLRRLLGAVPGLVAERSAIGGFSNGAHAAALLVAGGDEFTLEHFRQFYFVDGGAQFLAPFGFHAPGLSKCRFLVLRADQPHWVVPAAGQPSWNAREALDQVFDGVDAMARARRLDWTAVVMRGRKHSFDPEYRAVVGQWVRGETMHRPGDAN